MNIQYLVAAVTLAVAATVYAQPMAQPMTHPMMPAPGGPGACQGSAMECKCHMGRHDGGWMCKSFFCPELVMRHQKEIGLTEDQRRLISTEMANFASNSVTLQWQASALSGDLADLLKQDKSDEKAILAEKEKLLKVQNDLELSQLTLLIRVKNALTPEQQGKLTELKKQWEHHPWAGHMMGHGDMGHFGGRPQANPQ